MAAALLLAVLGNFATAGTVVTNDGRTLTGTVEIGSKQTFLVTTPGQAPERLAAADIRDVRFEDAEAKHGLTGEYFAHLAFSDLQFVRVDRDVGFQLHQPAFPGLDERFSVRWTGFIEPRYSEVYTLGITVDDGARVWIDGKLVIDHWAKPVGDDQGQVPLLAGRKHALRIDYHNGGGGDAKFKIWWSSPQQNKEPLPAERLYPAAPGKSAREGLLGEYYTGETFGEKVLTRVDRELSFDWTSAPPDPMLPHDHYSVRWTGFLRADVTDDYTLTTASDDGSWVWLDDKQIIENGGTHGVIEKSGKVRLEAGKLYPLRVEFFQSFADSSIKFYWARKDKPREIIPASNFVLPRDYRVLDGPTLRELSSRTPPGVMTVDGNFQPSEFRSLDAASATFKALDGKEFRVARAQIARIFTRELCGRALGLSSMRSTGVVTAAGEAVPGDIVTADNNNVQLSTVVLGITTYDLHSLALVALRPVRPPVEGFRIYMNDDIQYVTGTFESRDGTLICRAGAAGEVHLPQDKIARIARLDDAALRTNPQAQAK
jgi:hypothetical protein